MNAIQYFDWGGDNNTLLDEFTIRNVFLSYDASNGVNLFFHNDVYGKNFYTNSPNISVNYKETSTDWFLQNYTKGNNRPAIMIEFKYANTVIFFEKISTNELSFVKMSDTIYLSFSDRQKQLLLNGDIVTENIVLRSSKTHKTQRFKITAINR
jgi:hypothetical protein